MRDAWPGGVTRQCRDLVKDALVNTVREAFPAKAKTRAAAGVVLGRIGDPRPEIMTLEKMEFCLVPGGDFVMSEKDDEKEICRHLKHPFWMGRFPVSNAQYKAFTDAGGYAEKKYWTEAVKDGVWKDGTVKGRYKNERRSRPLDWGRPLQFAQPPGKRGRCGTRPWPSRDGLTNSGYDKV